MSVVDINLALRSGKVTELKASPEEVNEAMRLRQNESSQMDSQKEKGVHTAGGERSFKR